MKNILFLPLLFLLFASCKEESLEPEDQRAQVSGTFKFYSTNHVSGCDDDFIYVTDTTVYRSEVYIFDKNSPEVPKYTLTPNEEGYYDLKMDQGDYIVYFYEDLKTRPYHGWYDQIELSIPHTNKLYNDIVVHYSSYTLEPCIGF